MKQVKVTHVDPPDKSAIRSRLRAYGISLAPGVHLKTKNLKSARALLVQWSDLLSDTMTEINFLLPDLFTHYRAVWPYLGRPDDIQIKSALESIHLALDRLGGASPGVFGNFFAFNQIHTAAESLATGYGLLSKIYAGRSDWSQYQKMKAQKKRAAGLLARLYGFLESAPAALNQM